MPADRDGSVRPLHDRLRPPAETVARIRPRFAEFGLTRLARVTGLDRIGIPVWVAVRPASRTLAVNQGKGVDDDAAMASATMEAVEFAVAERGPAAAVLSSAAALARDGRETALLPGLVARGRAPPGPHETTAWVPADDLVAGGTRLVPAEAVGLDHTRDPADPAIRYWQSTDGLASGNDRTEAILHGLLERIERDATTLWRLAPPERIAATCVDAGAFADPTLSALAGMIAEAGLRLTLFDLTADTGIPVVTAVIGPADPDRRGLLHFDFAGGTGCHPDPARAAIRAVTEAAQSRLTVISGGRDDYPPDLYVAPSAEGVAAMARLPAVAPPPARPDRLPAGAPGLLDHVLDRIRAAGVRSVLAVPLTAPAEPDFAVVKVIVEDLETVEGDRRTPFGPRALRAAAWRSR